MTSEKLRIFPAGAKYPHSPLKKHHRSTPIKTKLNAARERLQRETSASLRLALKILYKSETCSLTLQVTDASQAYGVS